MGNADGSDITELSHNDVWDSGAVFSPNGRQIAFYSDRDADRNRSPMERNFEIYVMNADGTAKTNLTNNDDVWDGVANWSPDSRHIVFSSDRDRDQTLPPVERGRDLYVMTAAGRNVKRLTQTGYNSMSDWSPDGRRIAYQRDDEDDHAVYLMNADGTGHTRLVGGADPVWSPNGQEIAFRGNGPEIISPDATNRRRINTSITVRNLHVQDWSAP